MLAAPTTPNLGALKTEGPAEVTTTSPSHGPNNPNQEKAMDRHINTMRAEAQATEDPHERRPAERAAICAAVVDDADRGAEDWGGSGTLGGYFYCKTVFNRSVEIDVGFRRTYRNQ